jgi:hypothetical protein
VSVIIGARGAERIRAEQPDDMHPPRHDTPTSPCVSTESVRPHASLTRTDTRTYARASIHTHTQSRSGLGLVLRDKIKQRASA